MHPIYTKFTLLLLFILVFCQNVKSKQNENESNISGSLILDESWGSEIYLSYIPTFDEMYIMSSDMIIAKTEIDSLGNFIFDISFLPEEEKLYRLHIVKEGDSPATLIIGGKDENHLFFVANCNSNFNISTSFSYPPFRNTTFMNSMENSSFQQINRMIYDSNKALSVGSPAKRLLLEEKLEESLIDIADTSDVFIVSLYAIYKSNFKNNYASNTPFYKAYLKKWKNKENLYLKAFKRQLPIRDRNIFGVVLVVLLVLVLSTTGVIIWKNGFLKRKKYEKLSIQERKIFELLRQGATNQEISDQCVIGISTVKTHVSNIYAKLNVKSRKQLLDIKFKN